MKINLPRSLTVLLGAGFMLFAQAQERLYWVGGSGDWSDATHWAVEQGGPGGAGLPRKQTEVVLNSDVPLTIRIDQDAWCNELKVAGPVTVTGDETATLRAHGGWSLDAQVAWSFGGVVQLEAQRGGHELDLGRARIGSDLWLSGGATWSMVSDLVLDEGSTLVLKNGTLVSNNHLIRAGALRTEGNKPKRLILDGSAMILRDPISTEAERILETNGSGVLSASGQRLEIAPIQARGITPCGTGPGQTPFTIDAQLLSDYNGFGVSCKGACDAVVTVQRTGGVGPFVFQWLFGGPMSQTWNGSCAGTQVVIVTDQGQGVSCSASIQVTDPGALGVIFFPAIVPPACADVCDGQANAIAVGGTGVYGYDWNSGSGTGSFFNGLCAGVNTLEVTDNNGCSFDTTFTIALQPITVDLVPTNAGCFGECDGSATVNPSGGTGNLSISWSPTPPIGQGTTTADGLCAGPWSVTIQDDNGCDTTVNFIIDEPPPLETNPSSTDASCGDVCDGTASVVPSGSPGPFIFQWTPTPPIGDGTASVSELCAGTWTVLVTDQGTGCDTLITFLIDAPPLIDPQLVVTDATCSDLCNGEAEPQPSGGQGPYTYFWTPPPPNGQGASIAQDLCPGNYSVLITDALGCDTLVEFTVAAPPELVVELIPTDATCAGLCDGSATLSIAGGTPNYTIVWSPQPPNGQGTGTVTELCAGPWSVSVTDANGCDTTIQFQIFEPPPLDVDLDIQQVSCGTLCDGIATANVTGGTAGYTYQWSPEPGGGQGSPEATGLCAGQYTLLVTDANSCELLVPFEILGPVELQPVLDITDASCPGECDGTASLAVTGGTLPYTFLWTPEPGVGQGTSDAIGLCSGNYLVTITDSVGCDTTLAFEVLSLPEILPNELVEPPACWNSCDGSIVLAPSGGDGTFTFDWDPAPSNGDGTAQALGLCAGTYQVLVSSGGCDTTLVFDLQAPAELDVQLDIQAALCPGSCDGQVLATVSGGTPGYDLQWTPAPSSGQGTPNAVGFCAGPVQLVVTDALGCDTTIQFFINGPPPFDVVLDIGPASCGGLCDGTADALVSGANGGYSFDWQPLPGSGQGTPDVTGLCPGPATLTVTDQLGCDTTIQFIVDTPSGISAVPSVGDASCADLCDGTIDLVLSGGLPPYAFTWVPSAPIGNGTPNVAGLCPGTYSVTISDQASCDTVLVIDVGAPLALLAELSFTNESCNGPCDGTANVQVSGGQPGYQFTWAPPPPIGDGTASVSGLCAGEWAVTITDLGGCDTTIVFEVLPEQPYVISHTQQNVSCFFACDGWAALDVSGGVAPYQFIWSPAPGGGQGTDSAFAMCGDQYAVQIIDAAGCDTTYSLVIEKPVPITGSLITQFETCDGPCTGAADITVFGGAGGYTFEWQPAPGGGQGTASVTGLCASVMNYTVTVGDSLGCDTTFAFVIGPFEPIVPNLSTTPLSCSGECDGTATVGPTGGEPPFSYVWTPEPGAGQNTPSVTGLCAGVYSVQITDNTFCDTLINVLITEPDPIEPGASISPITCAGECDGSIVLSPTGGNGGFLFDWDPAPPNGDGTNAAFDLCPGNISVTITDANGCDTTVTFELTEPMPVLLDAVATASECQLCNGTATASVSGGTPPYSYGWTDANNNVIGTDSLLSGLCAGIYTVLVSDQNGCEESAVISISDVDGEQVQAVGGTTSCPNTCDGTANVQYVCSDPPCTVLWTTSLGVSLGQTADTATGLCAGDYLVQVTNNTGCITVEGVTVTAPAPIVPNLSTTPVSCAGVCDGIATLGPSGGIGPFSYAWDPVPPSGDGLPQASGLCEGVYEVLVTDLGAGCDTTVNVLIIGPSPIGPNATIQPVSCDGICDGSIVLSPLGGNGGFQFSWSPVPPNGDGTNAAFDLCPGDWTVTIVDQNGCDTTVTFNLTVPAAIVLNGSSTPSQCQVCDGTATVNISGGAGIVSVQWTDQNGDPVGTGGSLSGLCAGIYTVQVTDSAGCTAALVVPVEDSDGEQLSTIDGTTTCSTDCDGTVEAITPCINGPCVITWYDDQGIQLAQATSVLSGLCPGTYIVEVVNALGCISLDTATVVPGTALNPNLSTTPASCNAACDGTATLAPSGGVGPYTFVWSPPPPIGDGTGQVSGLCAGVYEVNITDQGTGCDTLLFILITEPPAIAVNAVVQDVLCAADCNGSIVLSPQGGVGGFQFAWDPIPTNGDGTNAAFGLCAGVQLVTITDANGCDTTLSYTITGPLPLQLTAASTLSECGQCNGTAEVEASGGTPPFAYIWTLSGTVVGIDSALTDLCAGLYEVLVQDANGCDALIAVPVADLDGEVLTVQDGSTGCPGDCDGVVNVSFTCSDPPCTIAWFDAFGMDLNESSDMLDSLCAGTYLVQVINATGCLSIDTATVVEPDPILPNLGTTPVTCFGDCDGSAVLAPSGGVGPYTYAWTPVPSNGDGSPQALDLCAGNLNVLITDSAGCSIDVGVLVLSPDPLAASSSVEPISCNGACDGSIVLTPSGGNGGYTYQWLPPPPNGDGTNAAFDLCAGVWTVLVTDSLGCDTSYSFTLIDPPALQVQLDLIGNPCFGDCLGMAEALVSGGVPPYATVWTDEQGNVLDTDTLSITGLCAGNYLFSVTDSSGCVSGTPFTIGEGAPIDAGLLFTNETCLGPCDGTASVSPSGGAGGSFTYLWQPAPPLGQGTTNVSGLCPGNWSVTITDTLGCDTVVAFTILPYEPVVPNADVQNISCQGACDGSVELAPTGLGPFTFDWDPEPPNGDGTSSVQSACPGTWTVQITDGVGCDTTFTFQLTEPLELTVALDSATAASCSNAADGAIAITAGGGTPGYTFQWTGNNYTSDVEDPVGLLPGNYTLLVTDTNGCEVLLDVEVLALTTVIADAGADVENCTGVAIVLDGSGSTGAVDAVWTDMDNNELGNTLVLDIGALPTGTYTFTLVVSDGPCTSSDEVTITVLPLPVAEAGPAQTIFINETATLGGDPTGPIGSTFSWSPDSLVSDPALPDPETSPGATTWFYVTVVAPNGCTSVDSVLITVVPEFVIPTGFSPNADGTNDTWVIDLIELFPNVEVEIYSRWGELLFQSVGYREPWDGSYKGGQVPIGTYYYVVRLNDPEYPDAFTGPLTVIR
ncbi:MAG: gliding motility-associated C-terminal domain-containing protein [Flavobacteriales bacterium]|nr:gliding motility-associated C-terminal domain-containing protein [Flavobacteriales bacterium]